MVEVLLLDLSGVLYDGDAVIPGAVDAVARAQRAAPELRFLTNTSRKTRADLLRHLRSLGFELEDEQLFTAVDAARQWLLQRELRPLTSPCQSSIGASLPMQDQFRKQLTCRLYIGNRASTGRMVGYPRNSKERSDGDKVPDATPVDGTHRQATAGRV